VCCPQQLPLTITSDEFKKPKSDDDVIPSKLGEILLELKVTNFPEGQKEISFELEIVAEDDPQAIISTTEMVPTELEYSCDCESTEQLLKTGRNPNVLQKPWKRNEAVLRCKSGEENGYIYLMSRNVCVMEMGAIALGDIWHFSKDRPSTYGTSCTQIRKEVSDGVAQIRVKRYYRNSVVPAGSTGYFPLPLPISRLPLPPLPLPLPVLLPAGNGKKIHP
jgi:hypothetical protein